MKSNLHTHTTFCDGKNTPEEMVLAALERNFDVLGFSGHGYASFGLRYCMKDTEGYRAEILRLKEKYRRDIRIFLGVEEDVMAPVDRSGFDYIITSSHSFYEEGEYYAIDSGYDYFKRCLALFSGDIPRMAETYFDCFCRGLRERKPDVIGHFDLLTKFDEKGETPALLSHPEYRRIAALAAEQAAKSGAVFEVNTGAMARGHRTAAYPSDEILLVLKKLGARLTLTSDCHQAEKLDYGFAETRDRLRDLGFRQLYHLTPEGFRPFDL